MLEACRRKAQMEHQLDQLLLRTCVPLGIRTSIWHSMSNHSNPLDHMAPDPFNAPTHHTQHAYGCSTNAASTAHATTAQDCVPVTQPSQDKVWGCNGGNGPAKHSAANHSQTGRQSKLYSKNRPCLRNVWRLSMGWKSSKPMGERHDKRQMRSPSNSNQKRAGTVPHRHLLHDPKSLVSGDAAQPAE